MSTGHWAELASRWDAIGEPLRPSASDIEAVTTLARSLPAGRRRCLVLGATSELRTAAWPEGTELLALDRSRSMVEALWETGEPGIPAAVLGDWRSLPLSPACVDLAVCDGGWHLLDRLRDQPTLAGELARVVRPGGRVAVRVFVPSSVAPDPDDVLGLLRSGRVTDANHLKVLLWSAVRRPDGTVAVADVWAALIGASPDLDALAADLGWPGPTLHAFGAYRGSADRYHLVDEGEVIDQLVGTGAFSLASVHEGAQLPPDLRFPTIVVERT